MQHIQIIDWVESITAQTVDGTNIGQHKHKILGRIRLKAGRLVL